MKMRCDCEVQNSEISHRLKRWVLRKLLQRPGEFAFLKRVVGSQFQSSGAENDLSPVGDSVTTALVLRKYKNWSATTDYVKIQFNEIWENV